MTRIQGIYTADTPAVRQHPDMFCEFTCAWCGATRYRRFRNQHTVTCSSECSRLYTKRTRLDYERKPQRQMVRRAYQRERMRAKRTTSEGREAYNAYMREYMRARRENARGRGDD